MLKVKIICKSKKNKLSWQNKYIGISFITVGARLSEHPDNITGVDEYIVNINNEYTACVAKDEVEIVEVLK